MKNELFSIGPFTVYGYGLMIALGVIASLYWWGSIGQKNIVWIRTVF